MDDKLVVEWIFRSKYHEPAFRLQDILTKAYIGLFSFDQSVAEDFADRNSNRIWNLLVKRLDEDLFKGLNPTFDVVDASRQELKWFASIAKSDLVSLKHKKQRLSYRGILLDYLDKEISDRDYEALGCVLSRFAGSDNWHLTPHGNEFGIDFVALIPSFTVSHIFPHSNKQLRLVGQSKKWTSRIKRDQVDLLANRLADIRRRNERVMRTLPAWFNAATGPVIGCMLTHIGAQSGAIDIANDHGIVIADRRDVAEIVVLSKKWDCYSGEKSLFKFIRDNLDNVLSTGI